MSQSELTVMLLLAAFVAGLGSFGFYARYKLGQIDRRAAEREAAEAANVPASNAR